MIRTAESVTEGHPDAICNRTVNAILDAARDASQPYGIDPRVAMECSVKGNEHGGTMFLFGEVTLPRGATINYENVARQTVRTIGYTDPSAGFYDGFPHFILDITQQSSEIGQGVSGKELGAGDQGSMIGLAIAEDGPACMPMPIMIAHALTSQLTQLFKSGQLPYLGPDGKSQVGVRYHKGHPVAVEHVTIAASHSRNVKLGQVRDDLQRLVIVPVLDTFHFSINAHTGVIINGAGAWTDYGPRADSGTTGRKNIVDSYGIRYPHGGGNFNGKDWTKVDMSGAVAARYVAKTLVANGLARKILIEVCYTIGKSHPNSVTIETFGTNRVPLAEIRKKARSVLDFSVGAIIEQLRLRDQTYAPLGAGGWFGREGYSWEQVSSL